MSTAHVFSMKNHSATVAGAVYPNNIKRFNNIKTSYNFYCDTCQLSHEGPETNYRPYMVLTGKITSVDIPENLQDEFGGIEQLIFEDNDAPSATAFFHFTDEDFANFDLVNYFNGNLMPDNSMLADNEYEFDDINADILMLEPVKDDEVPLIYVGVSSPHNLETDHDRSGYDLASYLVEIHSRNYETTKQAQQYEAYSVFDSNVIHVDDIKDIDDDDEDENDSAAKKDESLADIKKSIVQDNGIYKADGLGEMSSVGADVVPVEETKRGIDPDVAAIREQISAKYGKKESTGVSDNKKSVENSKAVAEKMNIEEKKTNISVPASMEINDIDDIDLGDD